MEERIIKGRRDLWSIEDDVRMNCAKYLLLTHELPIPLPLYNGIGNKKKSNCWQGFKVCQRTDPKTLRRTGQQQGKTG